MPAFDSVDDYLAALAEPARTILTKARAAIRDAIPKAEESVSYKIPTYKLGGKPVIYFAAWKRHYAVYPATPEIVAACKRELAPYEVEKGTIRFPYETPVPTKLLAKLAKLRAKQVGSR